MDGRVLLGQKRRLSWFTGWPTVQRWKRDLRERRDVLSRIVVLGSMMFNSYVPEHRSTGFWRGDQLLDTSGSKILMADDDRIVRRIVVAKLSGLGYDLTQAEDGQEALRLLEDGFVPDLVITDSLMPRMTGLELARSIRSSPDADVAKLPIIMLTSRQGEHDVIEGLQTGLDDYVTKPFSPDELAARVRTALWRARR